MRRHLFALCALFPLCLSLNPLAFAQDEAGHAAATPAQVGEISASDAWARATLPNQDAAAAYLKVANRGSAPDRLLSASSPAAERVEIHSMTVVDGVMTMRPVPDGLEVPAGGSVVLEPGGFHLMLMGMAEPLAEGGEVPLTLTFERAGALDVVLPVRAAAPGGHNQHGG